MKTTRRTVLAATVPENVANVQAVYDRYFNTKTVTRLEEAILCLDSDLDLILVNIHFDEGAFYDFLRIVKHHESAQFVPFFAIDPSLVASSKAIRQSIEIACKTLGVDELIHMAEWREEFGDMKAIEKVRELVIQYLNVDDQHHSEEQLA